MNKHFEDTRYYLKRAVTTATAGVREELEPIEERVRELTGREEDPAPGRFDQIMADLREIEERAEGEAREAIENARDRIRAYREDEPVEASN